MILVLDEQQLKTAVGIANDALKIIEDSFCWVAEGKVDMPPIMHMAIPSHNGDIDIKSAYVEGLENLTVKLGSGFFNNPEKGLPSSNSTMVVMSTETGLTQAVLLENGYLTNLRTGMAGAVAAKYLAPSNVNTVGIIGAGAQGQFQLECLQLVRDVNNVIVYSPRHEQAQTYADIMTDKLNVDVTVCDSAETLVKSSQIVVTTTPSRKAIIRPEWLHPGLHITAVGADVRGKRELASGCLDVASLLVCDRKTQSLSMGEFQHLETINNIINNTVLELGDLITGKTAYQRADNAITICDLTGMGVQDTAIAYLALQKHLSITPS